MVGVLCFAIQSGDVEAGVQIAKMLRRPGLFNKHWDMQEATGENSQERYIFLAHYSSITSDWFALGIF